MKQKLIAALVFTANAVPFTTHVMCGETSRNQVLPWQQQAQQLGLNSGIHSPSLLAIPVKDAPVIDGKGDDPLWINVPAVSTLVNDIAWDTGLKPVKSKGSLKLAYDDKALYALIEVAKDPEFQLIPGESGSPPKSGTDFVELNLQPGGINDPFTKLRINAAGGYLLERHVDPQKGSAGGSKRENLKWEDWAGKTVIGDHGYTIECRIPWVNLGVTPPKPGELWRGMLGVKEPAAKREFGYGLATSYSVTGFNEPKDFNALEFVSTERAALLRPIEVSGRLVSEKGEPIAWNGAKRFAAVSVGGVPVQTDQDGRFQVTVWGDPAEELLVQAVHPERERKIWGKRSPGLKVDFGDLPLQPLQPYESGKKEAQIPKRPELFTTDILALATKPEFGPPQDQLQLSSLIPAGGSDLQGFGFRLPDSLSAPAWQFEPADKTSWPEGLVVEPLWLHKSACRGLNRADDEAGYIWRYLRQVAPRGLAPGNLLVGALRMRADAGVPAGTYTGTLKLNDGGREVLSIPVSLRVPKVKLTNNPGKRLGIYYGNTLGGWGEKTARPADLVASEMAEIRRNGGSIVFMAGKPKYIDERTMIRMQIAAGFPPPYIYDFNQVFKGCWTQKKEEVEHIIRQCKNPQFAEQVRAELAKLDEFEKELNIPRNSIVCTWGDEIQRYDAWMSVWTAYAELYRSLTDRPSAITAKMGAGHFLAKWQQMAPYADYFIFSGQRQDQAQKEVPEVIPQFMELLKKRPGVQFWSYYNNSEDDGLVARANAGLWLWRSPFTVTMPWTFNFYENSPFTDLDNVTAQEDMVYACPDPDAPGHFATSLMWEGLREGFCDLRVAATLEQSLEAYPQAPQEVQDAARKALARSRGDGGPTVLGIIKAFGPEGFEKLRNEMLNLTERLNQGL